MPNQPNQNAQNTIQTKDRASRRSARSRPGPRAKQPLHSIPFDVRQDRNRVEKDKYNTNLNRKRGHAALPAGPNIDQGNPSGSSTPNEEHGIDRNNNYTRRLGRCT